jgi:hypothetical protein
MKKRLLIAETDEDGAVACVWVTDPAARAPRIFDSKLHGAKIGSAEVSGATQQQISAWLASLDKRDALEYKR